MEYPELGPVLEAILQVVPAHKIILFGSRARGDARPESDYDLLVVVPQEHKTTEVWKRLYQAVAQARPGLALDLLLATEKDLECYRDAWMTVHPAVLREGHLLYAS
ncbi:nucleotidyltransferase domain-containing protein [Thermus sediminis]|uniref:nucleotidyltransferase domain-containing protein n=1 Tax=Thermus sediminis TaxID=1761908 RepID=UPI000E3C72F9|nr:nucleotidyltransferase domain-containing protein [Thermus sediminis]